MRRNILLSTMLAVALFPTVVVAEPETEKIRRIGLLCQSNCASSLYNAFRQGLRDHGYIAGRNILIEERSMENRYERLPDLVADLIRLKLEAIVVGGSVELPQAVKNATKTIPIVFVIADDPVRAGLVTSFARPGENITGFTGISTELDGKRLELLQEIMPRVNRVATLFNPIDSAAAVKWQMMDTTARSLGIQLRRLDIRGPDDLTAQIGTAANGRVEALLVPAFPFFPFIPRIADVAAKKKLPTVSPWSQLTEAGGIMSYGEDVLKMFRRAATYVDKILKGAKPGELPVEPPMRVEFIINLKAAKEIGLRIPPEMLIRADRVIN